MNKTRPFAFAFLLAATLLFSSASALADSITVTLASPTQTGTAGSTLSFSGTISAAAGNGATVYLNGDELNQNFAAPLTALGLSDDAFFNSFVNNFISIDPGKSVSGLFFTAILPAGATSGTYTGTFQILGGADLFALDVANTANFTVNVGAANPVPEPSTWMLLATGLAIGVVAFSLNGKLHGSPFRIL